MGPKTPNSIRTAYTDGGRCRPTRIPDADWAYFRVVSVVISFSFDYITHTCHSRGRYNTPSSEPSKLLRYKEQRQLNSMGLCYHTSIRDW